MTRTTSSTNEIRERRLYELRREAAEIGKVSSYPSSAPSPLANEALANPESSYYGRPLLKPPQWTIEVPVYFFVGGMAGAASVIAGVGQLSSADAKLIRDARWLAAIGGAISPALLIADLGLPSRFLNMLRVFKVQSPMSVGSWTLVAFSTSAAMTAVLGQFQRRPRTGPLAVVRDAAQAASALTGLILATYTGVLVGATAIPVWNENVGTLPIHFAASGVAAAVATLELAGNESASLHRLAIGAAMVETAMGASIEFSRKPGTADLRKGPSGRAMRGAGVLSGPIPLILRLLASTGTRHKHNLRRTAAICSIAGSLLTRWAWVRAGKQSADDPHIAMQVNPRS